MSNSKQQKYKKKISRRTLPKGHRANLRGREMTEGYAALTLQQSFPK